MVFLAVLVFGYKGCKARRLEAAPMIYVNAAKNIAVGAGVAAAGVQAIRRRNNNNNNRRPMDSKLTTTHGSRPYNGSIKGKTW